VVHLGGGRLVDGAKIDPSVGLSRVVRLGEVVDEYTPLAIIHAASPAAAEQAAQAVRAAITVGEGEVTPQPLIHERIA
jgi:thymidine phosphorylase